MSKFRQFSLLNYEETVKLHVLRALVSFVLRVVRALMPHVFRALRGLVIYLSHVLGALLPHVPHAPRGFVLNVLSGLM